MPSESSIILNLWGYSRELRAKGTKASKEKRENVQSWRLNLMVVQKQNPTIASYVHWFSNGVTGSSLLSNINSTVSLFALSNKPSSRLITYEHKIIQKMFWRITSIRANSTEDLAMPNKLEFKANNNINKLITNKNCPATSKWQDSGVNEI